MSSVERDSIVYILPTQVAYAVKISVGGEGFNGLRKVNLWWDLRVSGCSKSGTLPALGLQKGSGRAMIRLERSSWDRLSWGKEDVGQRVKKKSSGISLSGIIGIENKAPTPPTSTD
jgi:hypothetical protein